MSVTATTDGKRINVKIPYRLNSKVKDIPGSRAKWDKGPPRRFLYWTYPLTMDTCHALRRTFGRELEVLKPLTLWARAQIATEAAMEEVRTGRAVARLTRVEEEAPELALALAARPYQVTGAGFMALGRQVILGDQPGLGKTLQTLAALIEADAKNILVFCPKTATKSVWWNETRRWTDIRPIVAQGSRERRENAMTAFDIAEENRVMLICNTEMMRAKRIDVCPDPEWCGIKHYEEDHKTKYEYEWPWLFEQEWDAIIVDESHQALASTAHNVSKRITQTRLGAIHLRRCLKPDGLAIALSGTPFRSDLKKAWGTLNWLRPDVFGSYWRFAEKHFEVTQTKYSKEVGTLQNGRRIAIPLDEEAFNAALRPYYLARDKATAAPDLPPVFYAGTPPEGNDEGMLGVFLPMEPKQAAAYAQMKKWAAAKVPGGVIRATGDLAVITRLRQFACAYGEMDEWGEFQPAAPSSKVEWILEFLRERAGNDGKVVIASSFTRLVKLIYRVIADEFGVDYVATLHGGTTDAARASLVRDFQDPDSPLRVAVINTKAGGVSITLDAADDMIITDMPWKSDDEQQLIDRIHRVSRIHNVTVYRLFSEGTIDEWVAELNDQQREALRAAKYPDIGGALV